MIFIQVRLVRTCHSLRTTVAAPSLANRQRPIPSTSPLASPSSKVSGTKRVTRMSKVSRYGKRPRQVKRRRLPLPSLAPVSSSSTRSTLHHHTGHCRQSQIAAHTSSTGASMRHVVTNRNSAMHSLLLLEKAVSEFRIALQAFHLHAFYQSAVFAITQHLPTTTRVQIKQQLIAIHGTDRCAIIISNVDMQRRLSPY